MLCAAVKKLVPTMKCAKKYNFIGDLINLLSSLPIRGFGDSVMCQNHFYLGAVKKIKYINYSN